MRRAGRGVLALVVCSTIVTVGRVCPLQAQTQTLPPRDVFTFYGGGAKAAAMAGAFIGVADDASAGYWNPAGLTQNDRIFFAADWGLGHQKYANILESNQDLAILHDNPSSQDITHFYFLAFNGPATIKGQRFYLSASWNRAAFQLYEDRASLTDFSDFPPDPTGVTEPIEVGFFNHTKGGPEIATLALATPLKEEVFSIGAGLNIYLGNTYDSSSLLVDVDQTISGRTLELRVVDDFRQAIDHSGVNFNFGGLFQTRQFNVGLNVRTPFRLKESVDGREAEAVYQRTTDTLLLINQTSTLLDTRREVAMPLQIGVGLAYRPQDNLLLSADYEFKGFSNSRIWIQDDALDPKSPLVELNPSWRDVHQIRLGLEYQIDVGWGVIPVRAGFRTEPLPYNHHTNVEAILQDVESLGVSWDQGDQVTGQVYALGAGVDWKQIRVNLTWEYYTSSWYRDGTFIDSFLRPEFIFEQATRSQRLLLGFTGYF